MKFTEDEVDFIVNAVKEIGEIAVLLDHVRFYLVKDCLDEILAYMRGDP